MCCCKIGKDASMTEQPMKTIVLGLLRQSYLDEEALWQQLDETERTAIGTWELWSAKDHMAHRTFWHQDLFGKVSAILQHQEVSSSEESEDEINAKVFEEHKLLPWPNLHAESARAYTELIRLAELLSE